MRPSASGRSPRARRAVVAAVACLVLGAVTLPAVADPGSDDDGGTPSKAAVKAAKDAVSAQEGAVDAIHAQLAAANERLEVAAIRAAQAAEAYNAARWKLREARIAARAAVHRQRIADRSLGRHQRLFDEVVAFSYEAGLDMSVLATLADGVQEMAKRADASYQVNTSMSDIKDGYEAALEVAEIAGDDAKQAKQAAAELAAEAADARAAAQAGADEAVRTAERIAERKHALLTELADLQDISVDLATRRQAALEAQAQAEAAAAAQAQAEAEAAAQAAQEQAEEQQEQEQEHSPAPDPGTQQPEPGPGPGPEPAPETPTPPTPPAPSGNASAAISFARAQLGEPYRWGAAGPSAWDCSGLTMRAWEAGGKSLPHYSAGQYSAATPIGVGQLRPGDLVFWGSSNSASSIYHVALYLGDNRIIHAPRTGRPVTVDSMYYWIPPNFFARP